MFSGYLIVYSQRMKKAFLSCRMCGQTKSRKNYIYCSNLCQREWEYASFVQKWKARKVTGLTSLGVVSRHIKRYLREKFKNQCCLCGWNKTNIKTGQVPLVADHIDGDWRNNIEINLRLICPNCDALSSTYAGLNRGKGRKQRGLSKRAKEGKLLADKRRHLSSVGRALLS